MSWRGLQRFRQYEAWMSSFAGLLAAQHAMHQRQGDTNRHLEEANLRLGYGQE
jgi:hypothetical protein